MSLIKLNCYNYILYIFIKNMNFRIKSNNINSETTENNSTKLMLVKYIIIYSKNYKFLIIS